MRITSSIAAAGYQTPRPSSRKKPTTITLKTSLTMISRKILVVQIWVMMTSPMHAPKLWDVGRIETRVFGDEDGKLRVYFFQMARLEMVHGVFSFGVFEYLDFGKFGCICHTLSALVSHVFLVYRVHVSNKWNFLTVTCCP
jgi:hypothetical protein